MYVDGVAVARTDPCCQIDWCEADALAEPDAEPDTEAEPDTDADAETDDPADPAPDAPADHGVSAEVSGRSGELSPPPSAEEDAEALALAAPQMSSADQLGWAGDAVADQLSARMPGTEALPRATVSDGRSSCGDHASSRRGSVAGDAAPQASSRRSSAAVPSPCASPLADAVAEAGAEDAGAEDAGAEEGFAEGAPAADPLTDESVSAGAGVSGAGDGAGTLTLATGGG